MLDPGTRLGPYTIVELVAVGGMGEVYRAEDERLHRDVAIKVLPSHLSADRASLDRFRKEACAVASLSHPNILSIFDYGEENGVQYAVTEMLEGETLRMRLARGKMTPREALDVMLDIADGVAAAHARGIVHRDLKPENIFITTDGRVKVLDFGLARGGTGAFAARRATAPTEILPTEPGIVLGTIGYLAPEQVEARTPTPATDVFALGCILYEMVGGRVPFEGSSNAHAMVAVLHDDPPPAEDPRIDAIVQRCLQKSPHNRPQNAGELAEMIRGIERAVPTERLAKRRRMPYFTIAFVALFVIATAIAAYFVQRHRNRLLDHGYDLRASDVRGDAETTRLLALALHADAEGNRPKAMELLEEAWRRPSKTAFPAAFLSSFNKAAGNEEVAENWKAKALQRLDGASPYESLLVRYLTGPGGYSSQELALGKSVLEIRPAAWRLHLGAAHVHLGQRERDAARRELQQIDPSKPDDRKLMLVLADRASLGDVDAAERDLRASRLVRRSPIYHYTEARIAWSRGNVLRAMQLYDQVATEAAAESLAPLEIEARLLGGIAAIRLGRWDDAQQRLANCDLRARQVALEHRVFESAACSAYAAHHGGDFEERDRRLQEAAAVKPPLEQWLALHLLARRLGSDAWKSWSLDDAQRDPEATATLLVIQAREAASAGDVERARLLLRRARAEGIERAENREDAELLAAELGLPSTLLPADPPYPNVLRYLAVFDYTARQGASTRQESVSTGSRSVSTCPRSVSTASGSVSTGSGSVSTGSGSVSTGSGSVSTGSESVSTGSESVSTGSESVSTGSKSVLTGSASVSTGSGSVSTGSRSVSTGSGSVSTGPKSVSNGLREHFNRLEERFNGPPSRFYEPGSPDPCLTSNFDGHRHREINHLRRSSMKDAPVPRLGHRFAAVLHHELPETRHVFLVHADAAVRLRLAERVFVARAVDVVVGLLEEHLHALHRVLGIAGSFRRFVAGPLRVGRFPRRVPDHLADFEGALGCRILIRTDGDGE